MFESLSISQKLGLGFGAILLIILVLAHSTWSGFCRISDSVSRNINACTILSESASLLCNLINIETGMRGFAITGRESFLEPLNKGKVAAQKNLGELCSLTEDNPRQQQRLCKLIKLYEQWLIEDVSNSLALRHEATVGNNTMDTTIKRISAGNDRAKIDAMRVLISEVDNEERKLLLERSTTMNAAEFTTLSALVVVALLIVALTVTVEGVRFFA